MSFKVKRGGGPPIMKCFGKYDRARNGEDDRALGRPRPVPGVKQPPAGQAGTFAAKVMIKSFRRFFFLGLER